MKYCFGFLLLMVVSSPLKAMDKDSTIYYNLPDSIKAIQFMAEVKVVSISGSKEVYTGIQTDAVKLSLRGGKKEKEIVFEFSRSAKVMATGLNADAREKGEIEFEYNWTLNEMYKLLLAVASDSAENFSVYSGYAWLPKENKWKLIGTCKIEGRWNTIQQPSLFFSSGKKTAIQTETSQVWCQRQNGSWKKMTEGTQQAPVINLFPHLDSVQQRQIDIKLIEEAIASGKTDAKQNKEGVYYTILKEGTGRPVSVNDTVVAYYKGYLFSDGLVFDQTKDQPATFPLRRLIRGWQIGVPICKVGGKIKLVIPSDLAYSIRTRAAKIPPNSILVFEIEVVDVKPPL